MLFLSPTESETWRSLAGEIERGSLGPDCDCSAVRANLLPAFRYFIAARLATSGTEALGRRWAAAGALEETGGMFSNGFLTSFLERHGGRLVMPAVAFADPRPFVHFAGIPMMQAARRRFVEDCGRSLPRFPHPLRIMDIGCGNGALVAALLCHLREAGKVEEIGEILLIDPSPAMVELARNTVAESFPRELIRTATSRFETLSDRITGRYDVALSSLAYHHLPWEKKRLHLERLRESIDHLLIFEVDANHDTPELHSPEMALSVYQSYGAVIDFVYAYDAPVEVVIACVDSFLMTEAVSLLTQARGVRTDYHMLRTQWRALLSESLGSAFSCLCDATCHGDDHMDLFTLHYGR
jgi:SAM-dependent methyltransferase